MSRIKIKLVLLQLAVIFFAACLLDLSQPASVQAKQPTISVSPAIVNLKLSKVHPQAKASITVTNSYSVPMRLTAAFKSLEPGHQGLTPTDGISPGLAEALKVSETDITVAPNSNRNIEVQATNQGDLTSGGHYAALVLTQQPPDNQPSTYRAALSVNLFMVNSDNSHVVAVLDDASANGGLFKLPSMVRLAFSNEGNVHFVPRAAVAVADRAGKEYCTGTANQNSQLLLPNRQSEFDTPLTCSAKLWWPHRMQTQILYRAEGDPNPQTKTATFWYIPPAFVIGCSLIVLVVSWILYRRFYRKII